MALDYRHEPLPTKWPGKTQRAQWERKRGDWKTAWTYTEKALERELDHLKASAVVIALDLPHADRDLRFDGKLRADARPSSPRVILSFTDADGYRQHWPCDKWAYWQTNVHAIMLTLQRLRQAEEYGADLDGKQYAGFRALPPGSGNGTSPHIPTMTPEEAATLIGSYVDIPGRVIASERSVAAIAAGSAKRKAHPDAGGSSEKFVKVSEAIGVLEAHFGGSL